MDISFRLSVWRRTYVLFKKDCRDCTSGVKLWENTLGRVSIAQAPMVGLFVFHRFQWLLIFLESFCSSKTIHEMTSAVRSLRIGLLPGDGIGREVIPAGKRILEALPSRFNLKFSFVDLPVGFDHFKATGSALPEKTVETLKKECDGALFGAVRSYSSFLELNICHLHLRPAHLPQQLQATHLP